MDFYFSGLWITTIPGWDFSGPKILLTWEHIFGQDSDHLERRFQSGHLVHSSFWHTNVCLPSQQRLCPGWLFLELQGALRFALEDKWWLGAPRTCKTNHTQWTLTLFTVTSLTNTTSFTLASPSLSLHSSDAILLTSKRSPLQPNRTWWQILARSELPRTEGMNKAACFPTRPDSPTVGGWLGCFSFPLFFLGPLGFSSGDDYGRMGEFRDYFPLLFGPSLPLPLCGDLFTFWSLCHLRVASVEVTWPVAPLGFLDFFGLGPSLCTFLGLCLLWIKMPLVDFPWKKKIVGCERTLVGSSGNCKWPQWVCFYCSHCKARGKQCCKTKDITSRISDAW